MWKNMTWLSAEWKYYFEWRRMALAARLEGHEKLPEKNDPWWYTFKWFGAVGLPLLGVLSLIVFLTFYATESMQQFALIFGGILAAVALIIFSIFCMVAMAEEGPSILVVSKWKSENAKVSKT